MSVRPITTATVFILFSLPSFSQDPIDLHAAVKKGNIEVYNRELSLLDEPAHAGIRLSKDYGEGVAWLKGVEFSDGVIEFDVRGEDVKQRIGEISRVFAVQPTKNGVLNFRV